MSNQRRHREVSVCSRQYGRGSRYGSQYTTTSRRSSHKTSKMSRHDRFSSGYGSLSETFSSRESIGKSGSPPPSYVSQTDNAFFSSSYDLATENAYESIPERSNESETCIQTRENVSAVRFSGRCHDFAAPDMMLKRSMGDCVPFKAKVNGLIVDYTPMSVVTPHDGKRLLTDHARKRFKLPTKVAQNCRIMNTDYEVSFRYALKTLIERRVMESRTKPYRGEKLRPCQPRSAWDYYFGKPRHFQEDECYFKVPNTEKLITCKLCDGNGRGRCDDCDGAGQKRCSRCHGFGREPMSSAECLQCGDGFETCQECHGAGIGKCVECEGRGKVISYQRLKVNWIVKEHVYVDEVDGVPKKQLAEAKGQLIHHESRDGQVEPITQENLFHTKIVQDSAKQIAKYRNIAGCVCKQKQTVHLVLTQRFDCEYKKKQFSFHVVGDYKKVYAPEYPNRRFKFLEFFTSKN